MSPSMSPAPRIAVFSDVICPWCFIGKRRLERALGQLGMRETATIDWLPFELNPAMPVAGMERALYRARKFGAERSAALDAQMTGLGRDEGIRFAFDRIVRTPNTRRAHRLIAFAAQAGAGDAVAEALFRAYFEEGRDIGDEDVLAGIGTGAGLARDAVTAALHDGAIEASVVEAEDRAARLGVTGVPFFIIDDALALSGAQPASVWIEAMRRIASDRGRLARP